MNVHRAGIEPTVIILVKLIYSTTLYMVEVYQFDEMFFDDLCIEKAQRLNPYGIMVIVFSLF